MIHQGGCHCGNLHVSLRLTQAPEEVRTIGQAHDYIRRGRRALKM